jgi:predicted metal-dependent enzyme (double-stranded beta helix superfamily)
MEMRSNRGRQGAVRASDYSNLFSFSDERENKTITPGYIYYSHDHRYSRIIGLLVGQCASRSIKPNVSQRLHL